MVAVHPSSEWYPSRMSVTAMMMKALAVSLSPLSSRLMVRNRMLRLQEETVKLAC